MVVPKPTPSSTATQYTTKKAAQIKTYRVRLPWRHRTKPKFKQTYTEKKVLAEQRALWRSAYDKALAEACDVMWDQAIKIQKWFGGHSTEYYFQEIMQGSWLKKGKREINDWNVYCCQEIKRINDGMY